MPVKEGDVRHASTSKFSSSRAPVTCAIQSRREAQEPNAAKCSARPLYLFIVHKTTWPGARDCMRGHPKRKRLCTHLRSSIQDFAGCAFWVWRTAGFGRRPGHVYGHSPRSPLVDLATRCPSPSLEISCRRMRRKVEPRHSNAQT